MPVRHFCDGEGEVVEKVIEVKRISETGEGEIRWGRVKRGELVLACD